MFQIRGAAGVLPIQVDTEQGAGGVVTQQVHHGDLPGALVLCAGIPPGNQRGKLLEEQRAGLGVILDAGGEDVFVEPDIGGRDSAVEEQQVGGDAGVGGKDAIGQAHDGMQVEITQQLLLDAGRDAVAEERAVGHDHTAAPAGFERAHDELHEEQGGLAGTRGFGEVQLDAGFLLAAEGRVGDDDLEAVLFADLVERVAQGIIAAAVGRLPAVQQQVHGAEQEGQGLFLNADQAGGLEQALILGGLGLGLEGLVGFDQETAGTTSGIEDALAQFGLDTADDQLDDRAGGVELAAVAGGVAHFLQH